MKNQNSIISMRYMAQFKCIGKDCEYDCCHGWNEIPVDKSSYEKLSEKLAETPDGGARFNAAYTKVCSGAPPDDRYATIALDRKTGVCPFLDSQGLCEIHGRFGEEYLSISCRKHPRVLNRMNNQLEFSGAISCPEIARNCLLDPDGCDFVVLPSEEVQFPFNVSEDNSCLSEDPYDQYSGDYREIILELLSMRQYPVTSRLFLVSYFVHRTSDFFYRNTDKFSIEKLEQEVDHLVSEGLVTTLLGEYERSEHSSWWVLSLVKNMQVAHEDKRFKQLVEAVCAGYMSEATESGSPIHLKVMDWSGFLPGYLEKSRLLRSRFSQRLDQYLENYCKHFWFGNLYTRLPNPVIYLHNMLARVAGIFFLLYGHPDLAPLLAELRENPNSQLSESEQAIEMLDRASVEVFTTFSKNIDHNSGLHETLTQKMIDHDLDGFGMAVLFLKFIEGA